MRPSFSGRLPNRARPGTDTLSPAHLVAPALEGWQSGADVDEAMLDEVYHARARGGHRVEEGPVLEPLHRIAEQRDAPRAVAQRQAHDLDEKVVTLRGVQRHVAPGTARLGAH